MSRASQERRAKRRAHLAPVTGPTQIYQASPRQRAKTWNTTGLQALADERMADAEAHQRQSIACFPTPEAWNDLGVVLYRQGRHFEAQQAYEVSLALDHTYGAAMENLRCVHLYSGELTREELFAGHVAYGKRLEASVGPPRKSWPNDRRTDRMLRIGFVSGDFRGHSTAAFFEPLLRELDRERFRIACFSETKRPDEVTARLGSLADAWISTVGLDNHEVASIITDRCGIDVLIDLAGRTTNHRLGVFALQPAPVSATWMGYPNTTGLSRMRYRIVDAFTDPPPWGPGLMTEEPWYLPRRFLCWQPPADAPPVAPPPYQRNGFVTFGSFNFSPKLSRVTLETWAEILKAAPTSRLLLKAIDLEAPENRQRILRTLSDRGVDTGRVELRGPAADQGAHLAAYGDIDVALDPFPYNGTTTTMDALWQGVPVVALIGDRHSARVTAALLESIGGHGEPTREDYVRRAIWYAQKEVPSSSLESREMLREAVEGSELIAAKGFARDFGAALIEMFARWAKS
jgi:protein O-GlcNAc transferase